MMKRSISSKSSGSKPAPDFKRLKAKVGKKAPQKANYTETNFRTASVQVRTQSIASPAPQSPSSSSATKQNVASLELISARGKALRDLSVKLNHSSPKVRLSALQGIKDATGLSSVTPSTRGNEKSNDSIDENGMKILPAIQANLSILIPSLSKCFIDEDGKVRSLATFLLFQGLVPRIALMYTDASTSSSSAARQLASVKSNEMFSNGQSVELDWDLSMLQPFLPLILAYLTSALHSLDADIRYDGCTAIELLCTKCSSLFVRDGEDNFSSVKNRAGNRIALNKTLPAFRKLLEDVGGGLASLICRGAGVSISGGGNLIAGGSSGRSSAKKKRKKAKDRNCENDDLGTNREKKKKSTKAVCVLRSLVSVLKILGLNHLSLGEEAHVADELTSPEERALIMHYQSPNGPLTSEDFQFLSGTQTLCAADDKTNSYVGRHASTITEMKDLHNFISKAASRTQLNSNSDESQWKGTALSLAMQRELLSKLRDRLVEVSQQGHSFEKKGLCLSVRHIEEFGLVLTSLQSLWNGFCRLEMTRIEEVRLMGGGHLVEWKKLCSVGVNVQKLLLESLPVRDESGNPLNVWRYDLLNASVCCAISEFGSTLFPRLSKEDQNEKQARAWVNGIFTYLLPRLESESLRLRQVTTEVDQAAAINTNSSTRLALLKVVGRLLVRDRFGSGHKQHDFNYCPLEDTQKRMELLEKFGDAFFQYDVKSTIVFISLCKSAEGRRAAVLLTTLITQHLLVRKNESGGNVDTSNWLETWQKLAQMASVLPTYLKAWKDSFPKVSNAILAALLHLTRQCSPDNPKSAEKKDTLHFESILNKLCIDLRHSLVEFFLSTAKKRKIADQIYRYKISIFEQLSESLQIFIISLVGMLKYPSESLILSLCQICSRRKCYKVRIVKDANLGLNENMIDYIMSILHSIRRTIPLQLYLTFIVNSSGIEEAKYQVKDGEKNCYHEGKITTKPETSENESIGATEKNTDVIDESIDIAFIASYDKSIARSCRYLTQCGGRKILLMLSPLLSSWIEGNESNSVSNADITAILKIRAALSILCCFARSGENLHCDIIGEKKLVKPICDKLLSISFARMINSDAILKGSFVKVLAPLLAFISCHPSTLHNILEECCRRIELEVENLHLNQSLISSMLVIVESSYFKETMRISDVAIRMRDVSDCIERITSNSPLDFLGGTLSTMIQSQIGFSF